MMLMLRGVFGQCDDINAPASRLKKSCRGVKSNFFNLTECTNPVEI
jgi:hypothetical protein